MDLVAFLLTLWVTLAASANIGRPPITDLNTVTNTDEIVYTTWEVLLGTTIDESSQLRIACQKDTDCIHGLHCFRETCRLQPPFSPTETPTSEDDNATNCLCRHPKICRIFAPNSPPDTHTIGEDYITTEQTDTQYNGPKCIHVRKCGRHERCVHGRCVSTGRPIGPKGGVVRDEDASGPVCSYTGDCNSLFLDLATAVSWMFRLKRRIQARCAIRLLIAVLMNIVIAGLRILALGM
ncbi:hypothetical protein FE257_004545 [Aspergillus nanangensis]|uniref:Uncharacterized protein n=1 Tax=Aspergillus nanangensis TaxID=2582783 RepID=A0AAD4CYQ8_ASPNN|nr:hypothetical protein FE257_004545 [Aspergillus nanangensis]